MDDSPAPAETAGVDNSGFTYYQGEARNTLYPSLIEGFEGAVREGNFGNIAQATANIQPIYSNPADQVLPDVVQYSLLQGPAAMQHQGEVRSAEANEVDIRTGDIATSSSRANIVFQPLCAGLMEAATTLANMRHSRNDPSCQGNMSFAEISNVIVNSQLRWKRIRQQPEAALIKNALQSCLDALHGYEVTHPNYLATDYDCTDITPPFSDQVLQGLTDTEIINLLGRAEQQCKAAADSSEQLMRPPVRRGDHNVAHRPPPSIDEVVPGVDAEYRVTFFSYNTLTCTRVHILRKLDMIMPAFNAHNRVREQPIVLSDEDMFFIQQYEEEITITCAGYYAIRHKDPYSRITVTPDFRQGSQLCEVTATFAQFRQLHMFLQTFYNALKDDSSDDPSPDHGVGRDNEGGGAGATDTAAPLQTLHRSHTFSNLNDKIVPMNNMSLAEIEIVLEGAKKRIRQIMQPIPSEQLRAATRGCDLAFQAFKVAFELVKETYRVSNRPCPQLPDCNRRVRAPFSLDGINTFATSAIITILERIQRQCETNRVTILHAMPQPMEVSGADSMQNPVVVNVTTKSSAEAGGSVTYTPLLQNSCLTQTNTEAALEVSEETIPLAAINSVLEEARRRRRGQEHCLRREQLHVAIRDCEPAVYALEASISIADRAFRASNTHWSYVGDYNREPGIAYSAEALELLSISEIINILARIKRQCELDGMISLLNSPLPRAGDGRSDNLPPTNSMHSQASSKMSLAEVAGVLKIARRRLQREKELTHAEQLSLAILGCQEAYDNQMTSNDNWKLAEASLIRTEYTEVALAQLGSRDLIELVFKAEIECRFEMNKQPVSISTRGDATVTASQITDENAARLIPSEESGACLPPEANNDLGSRFVNNPDINLFLTFLPRGESIFAPEHRPILNHRVEQLRTAVREEMDVRKRSHAGVTREYDKDS